MLRTEIPPVEPPGWYVRPGIKFEAQQSSFLLINSAGVK